MADITRRGVLTGAWRRAAPVIRPPWSRSEDHFIESCTRCNHCLTHCETSILISGPGGYPVVDFLQGGVHVLLCLCCRLP